MKHLFKKQLITGVIISLVLTFNCFAAHSFSGKYISVESSDDGAGRFTYSVSDGTATGFLGGNTNIFKLIFPADEVTDTFSPPGWVAEITDDNVVWSCTNSALGFIPGSSSPLEFYLQSDCTLVSNLTGTVSGELYTNNYNLYRSFGTVFPPTVNLGGVEDFTVESPVVPEPISGVFSILFSVFCILFFWRKHILNIQYPTTCPEAAGARGRNVQFSRKRTMNTEY